MKPANSTKKQFLQALKLGAITGLLLCLTFLSGAFQRLELITIDARYHLKGETTSSGNIVIVGITQRCLNQLGKFPWPRKRHAELINFLKKSGAKIIAIDIFFSQRGEDPLDDEEFAAAIKNAGNVILPVFMPYRITDFSQQDNFIYVDNLVESIPEFSEAALGEAHINMISDADGVYRKVPLAIKYSERMFFNLGLEAVIKYLGIEPSAINLQPGYAQFGGRRIPLEQAKFIYMDFSDLETTAPRFAFSDVIKGLVPGSNFKGKIVFVGQTTQGMPNADILQTPFKEKYGLTIQASVADTILRNFYIKRAGKYQTCLWIVLLCLFTCLIMISAGVWASIVAIALLISGLLVFAIVVFKSDGMIIELVPLIFSVATSIVASILYRIRFADRMVKIKQLEINELFLSSIKALAETIDAKDPYTHGHVERVTKDALAIATEMGLSKTERRFIEVGSILHDIGKIGVKDSVLTKPAQLTSEEKELFDQHPDIGSRIMKPISQLENVIPLIRHHHESYDGTGYPDRLKGEEIPLGARIIAVADTFDAMTSDRPYRKALPQSAAKQEINKLSGKQFDPKVVTAFNTVYEKGKLAKAQ